MAKIKEFKGVRPPENLVKSVAELPYDVVSSDEAREIAEGNKYSFYHIIKPEIDLPEDIDTHDERVYRKGKENLDQFIKDKILIQDDEPRLYLYTLVMNGIPQTGLVTCTNISDYENNVVKKHEFTRPDKENDRSTHLNILNANTGPVFLLYKEDGSKKSLFEKAFSIKPSYEFTADDGVEHIFRVIDDKDLIESFKKAFENDPLYIADGHHRAASAANVGKMRNSQSGESSDASEHNWFLTVIFPHDQLRILPYNRAVKDLNGQSKDELFKKIEEKFFIENTDKKQPESGKIFSMYIDNEWYLLTPKFKISDDPVDSLDVNILQKNILDPILGIQNPRTDKRIEFIGGIRGPEELEKLVNSSEFEVAFSMFPTTVQDLINISDNNSIMPPKSTWFEPKLRSGMVLHLLD